MELFSFLALATMMVVLTTSIHLGGLAALIALMRWREGRSNHVASAWWQMALILGVVQGLFFLHAVQIWVYAALYRFGGVIETFEAALYFSTSTFTTVGYGDIVSRQRLAAGGGDPERERLSGSGLVDSVSDFGVVPPAVGGDGLAGKPDRARTVESRPQRTAKPRTSRTADLPPRRGALNPRHTF
jgi:hypothetical protein